MVARSPASRSGLPAKGTVRATMSSQRMSTRSRTLSGDSA